MDHDVLVQKMGLKVLASECVKHFIPPKRLDQSLGAVPGVCKSAQNIIANVRIEIRTR